MSASDSTPAWMRRVLLAAAVYNIAWGAFAVLLPNTMFDWLGMERPNYPQFWQCIGMIVGVYCVGYGIAAFDPVRHWPIVLVGFLGKVFGPLGMAQALWTGALPWTFAANCVFNDILWWIPFALILRHAWHVHRTDAQAPPLPDEATLLAQSTAQDGRSLAELSREKPLLLVLLRHSGCTFCREAMAEIAASRPAIEAQGVRIVLAHMGNTADFSAFAEKYGLGDVAAVSDPERRLYRGLGLKRGRLAQLFGLSVWKRGFAAFRKGHGVGLLEGDGLQMPGVFVIADGRVTRRFLHETAADRPDYVALASHPVAAG